MDHVIEASIAAFTGKSRANTFAIFRHGLSAWWVADAQALIASRGFVNRQICNTTATNGPLYERKILGDSPEMCRALDSHDFADLKAGLLSYASFNSLYSKEDPRRFHLGTHPSCFLQSSVRGASPQPASASLKTLSSSPVCSIRS